MEVISCHEPRTVKQLSGLRASVNPEKILRFSLGFGVDPSPQIRYRLIVGSVAAWGRGGGSRVATGHTSL